MRPDTQSALVLVAVVIAMIVVLASCDQGSQNGVLGGGTPGPSPSFSQPDSATSPRNNRGDLSRFSGKTPNGDAGYTAGPIGHDEAGELVRMKFGGDVVRVDRGADHHGDPTWEVEVADSSRGRIVVRVDRGTRQIVSVEPAG